jgi:hypothetical protein
MSQSGSSIGLGFTGDNVSLSIGTQWGEKRITQGTYFTTATNIPRIDHRFEDYDTRAGVNASVGFSSEGFNQVGVSLQVKDQTFAFDSRMVNAFSGQPSEGDFGQARHLLSQANAYRNNDL